MDKSSKKIFIIPVFIPHEGCPHRCIFCNQTTITGKDNAPLTPESLNATISEFLKYKQNSSRVQISFYGGTFLGLENNTINMCLTEATKFISRGQVDSIRFSTRPDSITKEKIDIIAKFPVETIELGAQSMDNLVLAKSGRGHTAEDTITAVEMIKANGYETGLQLMPGLPLDTEEIILETTRKAIELNPDFVRIYPTIALKGSGLEKMVSAGIYSPLGIDECVDIVKKMYLNFSKKNIPVIRMGLQSSIDFDSGNEIIEGPYHPAFGHLIFSSIFLEMAILAYSINTIKNKNLLVHVNPKDISKMRGLNNSNISVLSKGLNLESIQVKADDSLELNSLKINDAIVDITSLYKTI